MWKDAYLIGMDQIDQQHKQLIGALDDLAKCVGRDEALAGEKCRQTVRFLKAYAVNHFNSEEIFQQSIGYPFAEEHRRLHEDFKTTLHELDLELMRSGYSIEKVREVVSFLTRWWIYHIMREDKRMVEYIV